MSNQALVARCREKLDVHYQWFSLARTAGRGDGLVVLVRHGITIMDRHDIFFRDLGDRVALLLRLDYSSITKHGVGGGGVGAGGVGGGKGGGGAEVLLVNTHLLFPHERYFDVIRMRELRKILGFLELYRQVSGSRSPLMLCGDFNGGPTGMQYRYYFFFSYWRRLVILIRFWKSRCIL